MNVKIEFEKNGNRNDAWIWHHGVAIINGKEYFFSLLEMCCSISGTSSFDLTWCDETPENASELEKLIMYQFNTMEV